MKFARTAASISGRKRTKMVALHARYSLHFREEPPVRLGRRAGGQCLEQKRVTNEGHFPNEKSSDKCQYGELGLPRLSIVTRIAVSWASGSVIRVGNLCTAGNMQNHV